MKTFFVVAVIGVALALLPLAQSIRSDDCQDVLVYQAQTEEGTRYYQLTVNQPTATELPFANLAAAPTWSPDGTGIAIATRNAERGFDVSILSDIHADPVLIASGQAATPVLRWSPDSHWIAFQSDDSLFIISRTGEVYRRIEEGSDGEYFPGDWSPDGQHIVVSMHTGDSLHLLLATSETGELQAITAPVQGVFDYFAGWTPDSHGILFTTNRYSAEMALYHLDLQSEAVTLSSGAFVRSISWNPSMTQFTYAVSEAGLVEVFVKDWSTGEARSLTAPRIFPHENFTAPEWSPSGAYIAFAARNADERGPAYEVYAIHLPTAEILQLTANHRNDDLPYWVPCQP